MRRPRVVALIAAAAASPLTLIVAPAGSGKSRAIAEFLEEAAEEFTVIDAAERLDAAARAAAVAAIDRGDEGRRWILATRSSEGLPIGSWLAYGRASRVIGRADLNVTASEVREDVVAFTGGWAVAAAFAHGLAESGVDLRAVRDQTREMMRSFLDERFYCSLTHEQQVLLEVACVLPAMDVALLERAAFPDAYDAMLRIAAQTAMIWEIGGGRFACNDITAEYVRRRIAMRDRAQRSGLYERAAAALEGSGAIGAALDAYVAADRGDRVVRLLHERGLQLIDRAHVDAVHRAIDALDDKVKREDAGILTLRGVAHAAKGHPMRAEGLLKRALRRAGNDKPAHAAATLRLSLLLANRGEDAGSHLENLASDGRQSSEARAEAWSILAAHRALSGEASAAKTAIERSRELLPSIESDDVRAKVLQRIGVAAINSGDVELARSSLEEAAELAMELELFSLASRAYVSLCRLVLDQDDNVERHRHYSHSAVLSAKRADSAFDVQAALITGLSAEMLRGNEVGSSALESELMALRTGDEARSHALSSLRAVRMAWNGMFSEAHHILGRTWHRLYLDFDRVMAGALCGLFLAVDGRYAESSRLVTDVIRKAHAVKAAGLFAKRRMAIARLYCAVAESVNARPLQAATIVRQISAAGDDPIVTVITDLAASITTSVRLAAASDAELEKTALARLMAHGYADTVRVLDAIRGVLEERKFLKRVSVTPAEVTVLRHLNEGLSPKEIAARTGRSIFTVRAHIANAIAKLKCNGRTEAVAVARRLGLLD